MPGIVLGRSSYQEQTLLSFSASVPEREERCEKIFRPSSIEDENRAGGGSVTRHAKGDRWHLQPHVSVVRKLPAAHSGGSVGVESVVCGLLCPLYARGGRDYKQA
jgi:hypothetical protein